MITFSKIKTPAAIIRHSLPGMRDKYRMVRLIKYGFALFFQYAAVFYG